MKPTQEELGQFVSREVVFCQSSLVDMLISSGKLVSKGFDYENVTNLFNPDEEASDEQQAQEIYEWWLVSDWLLEKLEKKGQPVLKTDYGSWWGRTTTGQAILLDGVIEDIYTELHK